MFAEPYGVDGDPVSSHTVMIAPPQTAYQYARKQWEREHWGLPKDESQKRLWVLFFTNREPEESALYNSWTRPPQWVELLVRFGPPPASPAVTHTGRNADDR